MGCLPEQPVPMRLQRAATRHLATPFRERRPTPSRSTIAASRPGLFPPSARAIDRARRWSIARLEPAKIVAAVRRGALCVTKCACPDRARTDARAPGVVGPEAIR